ncbi:MAG: type II secretion system protein [Candidatus Marinimicrobia bacterium]|nr:type II secretion system protein [Candidatus Neomarinimicrobiota bacterium]
MKKSLRNQNGFTLVELMIVIVIVGILAAVAVPIYQSNINKAKTSECDAALGTIRTSLRVYYAEYNGYPVTSANVIDISNLGITGTALQGKYFDSTAYKYVSTNADSFTVTCTNTDIFDTPREMDQSGNLNGGPE